MEEMVNQMPEIGSAEAAASKQPTKKKLGAGLLGKAKEILCGIKNTDRKMLKKYAVILALAVMGIAAAVIGVQAVTNTYKTPVKTLEKYANMDEYSSEKAYLAYSNGLARSEWKQIFAIMHNSDSYMDMLDEVEEAYIKAYEKKQDSAGADYKVAYEIVDKLELEKSELRDYRSELQELVDLYEEIADEAEEFSSGEWTEFAEEMDLRKSEAKELIEAFRSLAEEMGRIEVDKGYELEVKKINTGSELEEPIEMEDSLVVLKVNGRWISYVNFRQIFAALY